MHETTEAYRREGFSDLDLHFARFVAGLSVRYTADVFLAAALASRATGNGDVCLDLAAAAQNPLRLPHLEQACRGGCALTDWREKLLASQVVGRPGDRIPLVLDANNRLYLFRYWAYEHKLAEAIRHRSTDDVADIDGNLLRKGLMRLFPPSPSEALDWQQLACATAVCKRFCVISGGPGTGKTTTVTKILALLLEQAKGRRFDIFLAAPTGKAAARLVEALRKAKTGLACNEEIRGAIPEKAYTLHRMLKPIPGSPYFQYNAHNRLPADVVIVDEASMVDLALMSKLMDALPARARLILLGDKDQLASVEAGAVLGDICNPEHLDLFSENFLRRIGEWVGQNLSGHLPPSDSAARLSDAIVGLKKSYRFGEGGGIDELSRRVKAGDGEGALALLDDSHAAHLKWQTSRKPEEFFRHWAEELIETFRACLRVGDPRQVHAIFNRSRILCAMRVGPLGATALNQHIEKLLIRRGLIRRERFTESPWYAGRPVMVTRNDYSMALFNGDTGIALADPLSRREELGVYFPGETDAFRRVAPGSLPEHETVFAMTVHKSQGSEFDQVLLVLPEKDSPLLTRELLYTGITRARTGITLLGDPKVLAAAIARQTKRSSGLHDALWHPVSECSQNGGK